MTKLKGNKKGTTHHERPALAVKKEKVAKVKAQLHGAKTVALVDVRNLPDRILQKARKELRGKADFVMAKNTVLIRALEGANVAKALVAKMDTPSVLVISKDMSAYAIFSHFRKAKTPIAAKPGQVAPFDIIVKEGETDLPPGPALAGLKAAGLNAQTKAGKIVIAKDSVVTKAGAKISDLACKALQQLGVKPFSAGLNMVAGVEDGVMYNAAVLDVDEVRLTADLIHSSVDAYSMSVNVNYPTEANRSQLLVGSLAQARALAEESGAYSDAHIESLLARAIRMQAALEGKTVGSTENKTA
ncbi:50S ribosomal protein L10 [uncultured archaeon]|nr:50S ribosomal protein L10 [uncultured archaeon]